MEPVEIRQKSISSVSFSAVLLIALIGMNYQIFVVNSNRALSLLGLFSLASSVYLAYVIFLLIMRAVTKEPIIALDNNTITIKKGLKTIACPWASIHSLEFYKNESSTYLKFRTEGKTQKIGINWLDRSPEEIVEIILAFHKKYCPS
jgi:DMSO/TMAO reductase YedYZ heme-binding membrane subunit